MAATLLKLFMLKFRRLLQALACIFFAFPPTLMADIRLPSVISDNMVLQRNSETKLWGWSNPGERIIITVSWNNRTDTVTANGEAKWSINVKTPEAGGPYSITFQADNKIVLNNILIGEVWVCSGQSNMEWSSLNGLKEMDAELPKSANSSIRLFHIPKTTADYPQDDCEGSWQQCGPESLKGFSAVAYFFGKKLSEKLKIPIGLINTSWGGTPAEVWTPAATINNDETLRQASLKNAENEWWTSRPGKMYNAMIAPVTSFNIAGVIWYQGESNTRTHNTYQLLLTSMIAAWREAWNKDFPFYYVQIAPWTYEHKNVGALLREAQTNVQGYPKTGMVVITDLVDDIKDIHPQNKHSVGERLANYALADTYRQTGVSYRSPQFKTMSVNKGVATVSFTYADKGFTVKGSKPAEWYVAGQDKQFFPADVKINGNKILVSSKSVKVPVAVRFAFSNEAMGNIFSKEGLPLNPFRTDDWELDTSLNQTTP
jgi:sialate O-acetylesterase